MRLQYMKTEKILTPLIHTLDRISPIDRRRSNCAGQQTRGELYVQIKENTFDFEVVPNLAKFGEV